MGWLWDGLCGRCGWWVWVGFPLLRAPVSPNGGVAGFKQTFSAVARMSPAMNMMVLYNSSSRPYGGTFKSRQDVRWAICAACTFRHVNAVFLRVSCSGPVSCSEMWDMAMTGLD